MQGSGVVERNIAGHKVTIDGRTATISAEVPETKTRGESECVHRNPAELLKCREVIPSFSLIRFGKVKAFIDGVYAAAEEVIASGEGRFSRPEFLHTLEESLAPGTLAYIYVHTARMLPEATTSPLTTVKRALQYFEHDQGLSLTQGFYDWTPPLRKAWRQIRATGTTPSFFFGQEGDETLDKEVMETLQGILGRNQSLNQHYQRIKTAYALLTQRAQEALCLFPPAQLPDHQFFLEESARTQSDIPGGLGKLLVRAIKEGKIDFTPKDEDGVYVWQLHEIVPLVKRDTPEFEKLKPGKRYTSILENEFVSQWAGTRHTHVAHSPYRQMLIGSAMVDEPALFISPLLEVEPFFTGYERMAESLSFLERAVVGLFDDVLLEKRRFLQDGTRSKKSIGEEFKEMNLLLQGLSLLSKEGLHVPYASGRYMMSALTFACDWIRHASGDADVNRDMPIFVPIVRETSGQKYICYVNAGFKLVDLQVSYQDEPLVDVQPWRKCEFSSRRYQVPVLVHREVRVPAPKLMNDAALRRLLPQESFTEHQLESKLSEMGDVTRA